MSKADRVIAWSTALTVTGVAAVVTQERSTRLTLCERTANGRESGLTPLTVDGLIYASSMVVLDSARRSMPLPVLARCLLGQGASSPGVRRASWGGSGSRRESLGACPVRLGGGGGDPGDLVGAVG
jgi:hypothetical protein